jgi:hypothetical protein
MIVFVIVAMIVMDCPKGFWLGPIFLSFFIISTIELALMTKFVKFVSKNVTKNDQMVSKIVTLVLVMNILLNIYILRDLSFGWWNLSLLPLLSKD